MDTSALLTLQSAKTQANAAQTTALTASAHNKSSAKNAELGERFEAMALSNLLSPMWDGLKTDGPFGGGEGEEAMKSFYVDAIANQMAKKGGVGISRMMQAELLKLQGAS